MKRRDRVLSLKSMPASLAPRLSCSLLALAAAGVIATTSRTAQADPAGTLLRSGTVPVLRNVVSGLSPSDIVTSNTATGRLMTINQQQLTAILNWDQFNIAAGSEVYFHQPTEGMRALNRIFDADPSIIQGVLRADQAVYLLNRNGILFDKGSQTNVNTLVASTLNLKDADFIAGFGASGQDDKSAPHTRFEDSWGDEYTALGLDPATVSPGAVPAAIRVGMNGLASGADARIDASSGGSIVLIAPKVENGGIITAPDGQVILAAGNKAYLWQRNTDFDAADNAIAWKASALRGLMVEITADSGDVNISGLVNNLGSIRADRGNVSIAALAINQNGRISASSSVVRNGSIWLTARSVEDPGAGYSFSDGDDPELGSNYYQRPTTTYGTVTFGAGSVTETPLLDDEATLARADSYSAFEASSVDDNGNTRSFHRDFRSWIHVVGERIDQQGTISAPGGSIDLLAYGSNARILLGAGSLTSAAGNWVDLNVADNMLDIARLTSNDLKDAGDQKSGVLLGAAVTVDRRVGSPLFDVSTYLANQGLNVTQKATAGGDIRIEARQGQVIADAGSVVDVSGGGYRYADGSYVTTKLIGADGNLYDIGEASPLMTYLGVLSPASRRYLKDGPMGWDVTRYFGSGQLAPTYERAYVEGAAAGTLSVLAPTIVQRGEWRGGVTLGRYQVVETDASALPAAGTLVVGQPDEDAEDHVVDSVRFGAVPSIDGVDGNGQVTAFTIDTLLDSALVGKVLLGADWFGAHAPQVEAYAYDGFGTLEVYANDRITVPAGVSVELPPGGQFLADTTVLGSKTSNGAVVELEAAHDGLAGGRIHAPAGQVSINAGSDKIDQGQVILGGGQYDASGALVAAGASIDTSALVFAEADPEAGLSAAGGFSARAGDDLNGYIEANFLALLDALADADSPLGTVVAPYYAIGARSDAVVIRGQDVRIAAGASVSAMGGFLLDADRQLQAGDGGGIRIVADAQSLGYSVSDGVIGALSLDGSLYGYALGTGGSLSLSARAVSVRALDGALVAGVPAQGELVLDPQFFRQGGFTDYSLAAKRNLSVADGTVIAPVARGIDVSVVSLVRGQANGAAATLNDPAGAGSSGTDSVLGGGDGANTVSAQLHLREMGAGERAATSLALSQKADTQFAGTTSLVLGEGARIETDPTASVRLDYALVSSNTTSVINGLGIELLGAVIAPGGEIALSFSNDQLAEGVSGFDVNHPDQDSQAGGIHLGSQAQLLARGAFIADPQPDFAAVIVNGQLTQRQLNTGSVIAGGSIALSAQAGRVVADAGSVMDVSAVSAPVDTPANTARTLYQTGTIWGEAGAIDIAATEASRLDGSLLGHAAVADGVGGAFSLDFTRRDIFNTSTGNDQAVDRSDFDHRIVLTQGAADSLTVTDAADPTRVFVTARLSADSLAAGGFDAVSLKSDHSLSFAGPVSLSAARRLTLDAPLLDLVDGAAGSAARVSLSAAHLILTNTTGNAPTDGVRWSSVDALTPVGAVATRSGMGILSAQANLIDVAGSITVNGLLLAGSSGTAGLNLASAGDIRLSGLPVLDTSRTVDVGQSANALIGALHTQADMALSARQVYPTTRSEFTLASAQVAANGTETPAGMVRFSAADGTRDAVLSAAGRLEVRAAAIDQFGTVKAPSGEIVFNADRITLGAGSLTSVSLDGLTVPLGETVDGLSWLYALLPQNALSGAVDSSLAVALSTPGEKAITLNGQALSIQAGATVDLSGGGDVLAHEFVAGPGGSRDVLATDEDNRTWAILPSMRLSSAPADTHTAARTGASLVSALGGTYDVLYVSGVDGIEDGWYPLLDAHYALLDGAYQVTAVDAGSYAGLPSGRIMTRLDGATLIAAQRGVSGTTIVEGNRAAYAVRSGVEARKYAEYTLNDSTYFATQASNADRQVPRIAADAGSLTLLTSSSLELAGTVLAQVGAGGVAAEMNISADKLALTRDTAVSGFVNIDADVVSGFGGSLLLGGARDASGLLTTTASEVVVATGANLAGSEILLAATDRVTVESGASVSASGSEAATTRQTLTTGGDGALLRASASGQLHLERSGTHGATGVLDIQSGARVSGLSILADATLSTRLEGVLDLPVGGELSLASNQIALGQTAGFSSSGLVLDNAALAGFAGLANLTLRSYGAIDLVGDAVVGDGSIDQIVLDAASLLGHAAVGAAAGTGSALVAADRVTLRNSGDTVPSEAGAGSAAGLRVEARRIDLGEGDSVVAGFDRVDLNASGQLAETASGSHTVAATLNISAPVLTATTAADHALAAASLDGSAQYALNIVAPSASAAASFDAIDAGAAGAWRISGQSVLIDTRIEAPSGEIEIAALGPAASDGVTLGDQAALAAASHVQDFTDVSVAMSGGRVTLSANAGDVRSAAGAQIDVSAASGSDAGRVTVTAGAGQADLQGAMRGTASGGQGGSIAIDAATIADLSGTLQRVATGGFNQAVSLRQRSGDLSLGAGDRIAADQVRISTDQGSITLASGSVIEASSAAGGGDIAVMAAQHLMLEGGSRIAATGTGAGSTPSDGGQVELRGAGGVDFQSGATVDVSAGTTGEAGQVVFAADRDATGSTLPMHLNGTVVAHGSASSAARPTITVRGDRVSVAPDADVSAAFAAAQAEYAAFVGQAVTIRDTVAAGLQVDRGAGSVSATAQTHVAAGVEIRRDGDLSVDSLIDLTSVDWNAGDADVVRPGVLSVRAAGKLAINAHVGLPSDTLSTAGSWSVLLSAGADLTAIDPTVLQSLATLDAANTGDLSVADNTRVRTATGDVGIFAGRDFSLGSDAAIYAAGREADDAITTNERYTVDGGDVRIVAQRDAAGTQTTYINRFLRRSSLAGSNAAAVSQGAAGWWVYRPYFTNGVGVFGGGDVAISAGRDVSQLSAYATTSARATGEVYGRGQRVDPLVDANGNFVIELRGGGDLTVAAGRNLNGGDYLVALGEGRIRAGGTLGAVDPTGLYLMGFGGDTGQSGAAISVEAGQGATLQNISNPTILAMPAGSGQVDGLSQTQSSFFTYTDDSAVSVVTAAGELRLENAVATSGISNSWQGVLPSQVRLASLSGDVIQDLSGADIRDLWLYGSQQASLQVLAGGDISGLGVVAQGISPDRLPQWNQPGASTGGDNGALTVIDSLRTDIADDTMSLSNAFDGERSRLSLAASELPYYIVEAAGGDLSDILLNVNGRAAVRAGRDITGAILNLQNNDADALTQVVAGRDILQDPLSSSRDVVESTKTLTGIQVAGPGTLVVQAGRNIDLGASPGVVADGNTRNAQIAATRSARVIAIAGVKGAVAPSAIDALMPAVKLFGILGDGNYAAMTREVADELNGAIAADASADSLDALASALGGLATGGATDAIRVAASAAVDALAASRVAVEAGQDAGIVTGLLDGMARLAVVDTTNGTAVTDTAAEATKGVAGAVFAGKQIGPGNINLFKTVILTTGGSGIDLVAPGVDAQGAAAGNVNAGLPSGTAANVGVLTQAGGAINAFLSGDFNVNQSKVLTAQGGDIMMYATDGSIDAGRGALTSRSSSAPRRVALYDDLGNFIGYVYLPPIDVTGSGIRTVSSDPDGVGPQRAPEPGSVYLFAPRGTINAGEAGIDSASDIFVRAVTVLNANAISAAGDSAGVPVSDVGGVSQLAVVNNPTTSGKLGEDQGSLGSLASNPDATDSFMPTILIVEVLGFGEP